jgi:hypothetical protein
METSVGSRARALAFWVLGSSALLGGCGDARRDAESWPELDGVEPPSAAVGAKPAPTRDPASEPQAEDRGAVLGFTRRDELALFDSATGTLLASAGADSEGLERDVALDRRHGRVLVLESDAAGTASQIRRYPIYQDADGQPRLGTRALVASIQGTGRLWPAPEGLLLFEPDNGPRWRLLRDDGTVVANVLAPLPLSAWGRETAEGAEIGALGLQQEDDEAELVLTSTRLGPNALEESTLTRLRIAPATLPVTARMAPLPAELEVSCDALARPLGWCSSLGSLVLVDVVAGRLGFRLLGGSAEPRRALVPSEARLEHVEQILVMPGLAPEDELRVAVLASEPPELWVASFGPGLELREHARFELDGEVRTEERLFSRAMLAVGAEGLLVSTSEGVGAVRLRAKPLALEPDPGFDGSELRGPLGGLAFRVD